MSKKSSKKGKKKVKRDENDLTQLGIHKKIRKGQPRTTRVINPKKKYDRKNTSWKNWEDDEI
jgi:hypothetical protein